jgi:regulatory protein YycH of two-component signal transduction system YycFG
MNILLQNKRTLDYVNAHSGWTTKREKARVFGTGIEALFFCFNRRIASMQILGDFLDARLNFTMPVTDLRGD